MPHFDLNKYIHGQGHITFTANSEKTYTVLHLTDGVIKQIDAVEALNLSPGEILNARLALFTGSDASEFARLGYREKKALHRYIVSAVNGTFSK